MEALVRVLGGAEAGELTHRPQAAAVHRGVDPAREGITARQADRVVGGWVGAYSIGQVGLGVERAHRLVG